MQVKTDGEFYGGSFLLIENVAVLPIITSPTIPFSIQLSLLLLLRNMIPYLNDGDKEIAQQIITKIRQIYPLYRNKHGYPYYGFWATNDPIMPHTYYFKYFKTGIWPGRRCR
jgi:hypothetical protein